MVTTILALVLSSLNRQIFNAALYKNVLTEQNIYARLPEVVGVMLTGSMQSGMPPFLQNLTATNWQAMLTILLPPGDLKAMTDGTLDQLFAYLNGETDTVAVSLNSLKERLAGPGGSDLILQLLDSQPPCTEKELEKMVSELANGNLLFCKPSDLFLPILVPLFTDLFKAVATQVPDVVTIIPSPSPGILSTGEGPFGSDPITTIRTVRLYIRLSPLLPLTFLLLITLFAVRSLKSWLCWWGIPIFASGIITLCLGILAQPILNMAWAIFVVQRIPPFIPTEITGLGQELSRSIVHALSVPIILQAIILLAIGLTAWIGSTFIKTGMENPKRP